jgi:hypothetical protein
MVLPRCPTSGVDTMHPVLKYSLNFLVLFLFLNQVLHAAETQMKLLPNMHSILAPNRLM